MVSQASYNLNSREKYINSIVRLANSRSKIKIFLALSQSLCFQKKTRNKLELSPAGIVLIFSSEKYPQGRPLERKIAETVVPRVGLGDHENNSCNVALLLFFHMFLLNYGFSGRVMGKNISRDQKQCILRKIERPKRVKIYYTLVT